MTDNCIPVGEDTRPKDRIKQGISSSTEIEEWDCTKLTTFQVEVEGMVTRIITVQARNIEEADTLAMEEFEALVGAEYSSIVD
tara:strand:- start:48 stop:296 length:249 start_codon:yes stop_codon:yes gene_type:complete